MHTVILKPNRSAPFRNRHPWLFSGAIEQIKGNPNPGDWVKVCDDRNAFIAYGLYNPNSQIRVRLYAFEEKKMPSAGFFADKISNAMALRYGALGYRADAESACRLINSEGDGISGLTVDRYGNYLCVQFTSLALYCHKDAILGALSEIPQILGIFLRTEADILAEEGLELQDGIVAGKGPSEPVIISENGVRFEVNLATGQKTGFYLDQRSNRTILENYAAGRSVLDLCTYTGGFALHAAKAGAREVTAVDVSANALELAGRNAALNGFDEIKFVKSDMFKYLDRCLSEQVKYDIIILDPPKMTRSKGAVQSALKGYLQLNATAMQCLNPHGLLFTCSCSGRISRDDFVLALHRAALSAGKSLRILETRGADTDHPVLSACPESEYLKCIICTAE
jgi:23S rRNA (cytosine1962-C5)-methyltransferase